MLKGPQVALGAAISQGLTEVEGTKQKWSRERMMEALVNIQNGHPMQAAGIKKQKTTAPRNTAIE